MTAPAHTTEHAALLQLVGNQVTKSKLIDGVILITIGVDGRPCVGGNVDNPAELIRVLRLLVDAENVIEEVTKINIPKDN